MNEQAGDQNLVIRHNTRGQPLSSLLDFPMHASMKQGRDSPEVAAEQQWRLLGQSGGAK